MDSNENSEDKTLDEANKMEVSDSGSQDKSNDQKPTKQEPKKVESKESNESKNVNSPCGKTSKGEDTVVESQDMNNVKINTVQNNTEVEKVAYEDKSDSETSSMKDMERLEIEGSESDSQETLLSEKDSKDSNDFKDKTDVESTKDIVDYNDEKRTEAKVEEKETNEKNFESKEDPESTTVVIDKEKTNNVENTNKNSLIEVKKKEDKKDVKNIKSNKDIKKIEIEKVKEDQDAQENKNIEKTKETGELKETKESTEVNESTETKGIKVSRGAKIVKDPADAKIIKNLKVTNNIVTREGTRKRKNTLTPPNETQQPEAEQQQQQQQNGSVTKRKRSTAVAALNEAISPGSDRYCWRCHKESVEMQCSACPRSWHRRCMGGAPPLTVTDWLCSECIGVQQAENPETRSPAMAILTLDQLCMMLKHIIERMRDQHGSEPFLKAVDLEEVPNYLEYVVKPMDLSLLESNVRAKLYNSTDAFMADARWIQHNCIVFNTYTSKLTNTAKQMLKVARSEVAEIEACPDCFAHGRNLPKPLPSWFIEPCRRPHPIVWAKLKGFPFWPAKAMPRLNLHGLVDVRFFGEHDRAWVSPKDMYLYSQEPPATLPRKKKPEMEVCVKEVKEHAKKLERVFGEFKCAPAKIQYDPHDPMQIKILLPNYDPVQNKVIKAANAKSEEQVPVADAKPAPAKIERRSTNSKVAEVPIANGVAADASALPEKRRIIRKKRALSPSAQQTPVANKVRKTSPEIETIVVIPPSKKNTSRSPSTAPSPTVNNNGNKTSNDETSGKDVAPEIVAVKVSNTNGPPKPTMVPIKRVRRDIVRKIRPSEDKSEELGKKPSALAARTANATKSPGAKSLSTKPPTTVVHAMPPLGSLPNCVELVDIPSPLKPTSTRPVAVLARKTNHGVNNARAATNGKSPQEAGKSPQNKVSGKPTTKEATKFPCVTPVPKANDSLPSVASNKPMTSIPLSAKKEQKAMFSAMSSSPSEAAKHLKNDKEIRLNSAVSLIKQEPKDDCQITLLKPVLVKKPSKARKSFPNKAPAARYPQQTSSPIVKQSTTNDAMVYIPPSQQTGEIHAVAATSSPTIVSTASLNPSAFELPPPEAGPVTAHIYRNSKDLANRVAQFIAETIRDAAEGNAAAAAGANINHHEATIHFLKLKIERMKWEHDQEMAELKHNNELVLRELKASMEVERYRALQEARREAERDKLHCIEETKRKQWCVVCGREAMFFCCWNTAYCDYPCQQKHWAAHVATCAQKTSAGGQSSASSPPTHQAPSKRPGSAAGKQQLMPKLVINRPQQTPVMRKT